MKKYASSLLFASLLIAFSSANAYEISEEAFGDIDIQKTDSCTATAVYVNNVYVACVTNVNGHEHTSDVKGLTELGCMTFCYDLNDVSELERNVLELSK